MGCSLTMQTTLKSILTFHWLIKEKQKEKEVRRSKEADVLHLQSPMTKAL